MSEMKKNQIDIDEKLNCASQLKIKEVVKSLPEEELSLAWRSELNEKLLAIQAPVRKAWWKAMWVPSSGLALAAAIASVMFFAPKPTDKVSSESVASLMLEAHEEGRVLADLGFVSVSDFPTPATFVNDVTEADLMPL